MITINRLVELHNLIDAVRRLLFFGNKMKIEASVLLGDRDEEVEVHGVNRPGFCGGSNL